MMSGEFSAIAASGNQNQTTSTSVAFAAAVERARQIAAKINPGASAGSSAVPLTPAANSVDSLKRPSEESGDQLDYKKLKTGNSVTAALNNIESGGGGGGSDSNSGSTSATTSPSQTAVAAAAQAAAVAARVAAASAGGNQGVIIPGVPLGGPTTSKDIKVPDRMVGLIIGRGGEQISRLQAESGCKIQMAPDSGGMPDRSCTLTGSSQSIGRAEDLIQQIVHSRAREVYPNSVGSSTSGMSPVSNNVSSSSRMSDMGGGGGGGSGKGHQSAPYTQQVSQIEIMVPGPKVGLIIGKGGETIKQLQEKSGAKMIIIQDAPSQQESEKPLRITGEPQSVELAKNLVYDLMSEKEQQMRGPRGGGRNGPTGGGGGMGGYNQGMGQQQQSRPWDPDQLETTISVPAGKCGVVIGKGGETIRLINQQTGAFCEIDRKQAANSQEKIFIIRGNHEQIENAKRMFSDKLNMNVPSGPINSVINGQNYGMNSGGQPSTPGTHGYGAGGGSGSQWPGSGGAQYQQQWPNSQQSQGGQQAIPNAGPATAGSGSNGVQINPVTGQPDYSAQWIEYYRSMGMVREAALVEEQAKANKQMQSSQQQQQLGMQAQMQAQQLQQMQQVAAVQGQQIPMGTQQGATQQSLVASGGVQQQPSGGADQNSQTDYSAQWAAYYRSMGKVKEAEAIEAQMKVKGISAPSNQTSTQQAGMVVAGQVPGAAMYGQQSAAGMYSLGSYQAANPTGSGTTNSTAANFYGGNPQAGATSQYSYPNYPGSYTQQPAASSDSH